MKRAETRPNIQDPVEYTVYIHFPANENNQFWEMTSTTLDQELALEQAHMLYFSDKYPKVEVVRKFFCRKRQKRVSETLRVFGENEKPKLSWFDFMVSFLRGGKT